nr:hypothetical protein [Tanacetum cinerariifolium]
MCTATINEDGDWLSLNVTGNMNCWGDFNPNASGDKREKGRGVRGLGLGRMPEVVVCAVVELLWGMEGFVGVERGGLRGLLMELEK